MQTDLISLPIFLQHSSLKLFPELVGDECFSPLKGLAALHYSFELAVDIGEGLLEDGFEVDSDHAKGEGLRVEFYEILEFQVYELKKEVAVRGEFSRAAVLACLAEACWVVAFLYMSDN